MFTEHLWLPIYDSVDPRTILNDHLRGNRKIFYN